MAYSKGPKPDWLLMERQATPNHTIDYLLWAAPRLRPAILASTLSHSMALWDRLQKSPALTSPIRPLSHNPEFPPGQNILAFKGWLNKGLYRIGHFLNSTGPLSVGYCVSKLDMPNSERYRLHQITHFLRSKWSKDSGLPSLTAYELWCANVKDQKGGVSIIYNSLAGSSSKPLYARLWERTWQLSGTWINGADAFTDRSKEL